MTLREVRLHRARIERAFRFGAITEAKRQRMLDKLDAKEAEMRTRHLKRALRLSIKLCKRRAA